MKDDFTPEDYKMVRALNDPKGFMSDEHVELFLYVAKEMKLDYKMKQICVIPTKNQKTGVVSCAIVTQIDGLRLIAERTGKYAPGKPTEFALNTKGGIYSITSFVKKLTKDGTWHEVSATALMSEYDKGYGLWAKMPAVMLEKCAEARALRRAFPDAIGSLYEEEEIGDGLNGTSQTSPPSQKPQKPQKTDEEDKGKSPISAETVDKIRGYIGKNKKIEGMLVRLCRVKRLEDVKEFQLEACRNFITAHGREGEDDNNSAMAANS